jgi:hypothetical protein
MRPQVSMPSFKPAMPSNSVDLAPELSDFAVDLIPWEDTGSGI